MMDFNGTFEFHPSFNPPIRACCEETTQNPLTMPPNMMGLFCREVATLHFSFGYQQDHLTASYNLIQSEPFTTTKLALSYLLHRRMFHRGKYSTGAGVGSDRMNVICCELQILDGSYTS
jgi:hypothetical protein